MFTTARLKGFFIGMAILSITSCGGGGGGGNGGGGGGTQVTVTGPITGFGSIIVNGIEFESESSSITVDDNPGGLDDLHVGMIVTISGTFDEDSGRGEADEIEFHDEMEGPVTSIDLVNNTITVMGTVVSTDANTVFEHITGIASLQTGDIVEVSGVRDSNGNILATYIELKNETPDDDDEIELKGTISNLDAVSETFAINDLTVDYSSATLTGFPQSGIANGQFVEVKGPHGALSGNTFVADEVQLEDSSDIGEDHHVEIKGIVTDYVSVSNFKVNGIPVNASNATGNTGISNGDLLEVEGTYSNGVLIADEVKQEDELEDEKNAEIEGDVSAVAVNTVTILSVTVTVNNSTILSDDSDADDQNFAFSDIAVGNHLEIEGLSDQGGNVTATRIKRKDADEKAELRGVVTAKTANTSLTILGVQVTTDGSTEYKNLSDAVISAATFYNAVVTGTTEVKVKWDPFTATTVPVKEAEIES